MIKLWLVIPCFNEEAVLPLTFERVKKELKNLCDTGLCDERESGVLFVDDGSSDATWQLLEFYVSQCTSVRAIKLSRNRGHQTALLAGLLEVSSYADFSISLDADLQDDISICRKMLVLALQDVDIVYGVRCSREVDTYSKRFWASLFYRLAPSFGLESIEGHADFRLLSSRVMSAIAEYPERTLYLRGMIPLMGFNSASISYARLPRERGFSKYPFRSSVSLAIDGIISLSNLPLRFIAYIGIVVAFLSVILAFALVIRHMIGGTVTGWTSIMVLVVSTAGLQMLALGLIGEYLARIYTEVKNRPRFHIQSRVGFR